MAFNRYAEYLAGMQEKGKTIPGFRYVKPDVSNFYSGLEMKGKTALMAGAAIAGLSWAAGMHATYVSGPRQELARGAVDVGSLPRMGADAVANGSGGKYDLGATGDLVFGLNNMRKGR